MTQAHFWIIFSKVQKRVKKRVLGQFSGVFSKVKKWPRKCEKKAIHLGFTEKNKQIIHAATQEFLTKGIDAASMHAIAENAEVSKRTLYKYYPSKEELYSALIDEILDRVDEMYTFSYSDEVDPREEIIRIIEAKIQLTLTDSFLAISKIIMGELLKGRMPNPEQMQRLNKSESLFVNWIQALQQRQKIKADIHASIIAEQFHSILKGQIYWPVLLGMKAKDEIDITQAKESTAAFFIQSFCDLH